MKYLFSQDLPLVQSRLVAGHECWSNGGMIQCPRCGIQVSELNSVDPDLRLKLQARGEGEIPPEVCSGCLGDLQKAVANTSGGVLMAIEKAKEQHRLQLWKSRVNLIKAGRLYMNRKMFSEAVSNYEKYLKILAMVFQLKKDEKLSPEIFKQHARTQELTVVVSVYWDLVRIYDSSNRYSDKQNEAARQLSRFIRYTPIYPDIMKKAESFQRSARNKNLIKQFIKMSGEEKGRCFIATAVYGDPSHPQVLVLRSFRDNVLRTSKWGRSTIGGYYRWSPKILKLIQNSSWILKPCRLLLDHIVVPIAHERLARKKIDLDHMK